MLSIILVEPQLGRNIGSVARAMLNFGLTDLRLVKPRDGWPNPDASSTAAGADSILDNVKLYPSVQEATADLNRTFATTAREHDVIKRVHSPESAIKALYKGWVQEEKLGVLFGNERCGLTSESLSFCEALVKIPSNTNFPSLNLSHAVTIFAYEWRKCHHPCQGDILRTGHTKVAQKRDLMGLFEHLESELDRTSFLSHVEKRPAMVKNIRNMLQRAQLTEQEIRTFRGIITSLVGQRKNISK